jgi:tRNA 2-thiouridine synthesizing protein A
VPTITLAVPIVVEPAHDVQSAMTETQLNLKGLKCPLPALKTRKALAGLEPGAVIVVECTDPLAAIDIPNLLLETRDILEAQTERDGALVFRIRKAKRQTSKV